MSWNKLIKRCLALCALALAASGAHAITISGNYNEEGYDVVDFKVASQSRVEFIWNFGTVDSTFSLFTRGGQHIITADDNINGGDPRLSQLLAAGDYSLLVSACCGWSRGGMTSVPGDDFNKGSFYLLPQDLNGTIALYDGETRGAGDAYEISISNVSLENDVPEPQTAFLMLSALAAMGLARRRSTRGR